MSLRSTAVRKPIPILLYHRVDDRGRPFTTRPEVFADHLSLLADRGYRSLTAEQLDHCIAGDPAAFGPKPFAITFDDGFAELETTVAPLLRDAGFTATAFLITSRCGPGGEGAGEHLSWEAARSLQSSGTLEFFSHSHTHRRWGSAVEPQTIVDDLDASLSLLADELGRPRSELDHLAWPFGDTTDGWERAAVGLGLTTQYVVQRGAVTHADRHLRLPRLMADGYSTALVGRWLDVLSRPLGAAAANQVFGRLRGVRRGGAYL